MAIVWSEMITVIINQAMSYHATLEQGNVLSCNTRARQLLMQIKTMLSYGVRCQACFFTGILQDTELFCGINEENSYL